MILQLFTPFYQIGVYIICPIGDGLLFQVNLRCLLLKQYFCKILIRQQLEFTRKIQNGITNSKTFSLYNSYLEFWLRYSLYPLFEITLIFTTNIKLLNTTLNELKSDLIWSHSNVQEGCEAQPYLR